MEIINFRLIYILIELLFFKTLYDYHSNHFGANSATYTKL